MGVVHLTIDLVVAVGKKFIETSVIISIIIIIFSYRCNQPGHFARDCPSDSSQNVCYNCNQPGSILFSIYFINMKCLSF